MTKEKGLAVKDEAKRYLQAYGEYEEVSPSFLRFREELGEKILASPNVRAAASAHISKHEVPLQEFQVGTVGAPMKYRKTSLKEAILKSDDPSLRFHKELVTIMDLNDNQIRELLQKSTADTIEKILFIYQKSGKILQEFLFVDLDSTQIQLLNNITRYFRLLEDETTQKCLESRKNIEPLSYDVEIDREKFTTKLWAFLDTDPLPLDFYMGPFGPYGEPVIGTLYRLWPCYAKLREKIENEYRTISSLPFEKAVEKMNELKTKHDLLKEYENEMIKFDISHWIYLPPRYAKKNGILGGSYIYVNRVSRPFPCPFCGRNHYYVFIGEVRKR